MKNFLTTIFALLFFALGNVFSQEIIVPEGYEIRDSLIVRPASTVDSSLLGKNIFSVMPVKSKVGTADVKVYQSQSIVDALESHIASNVSKPMNGYRIRIFFDNKQSARGSSEYAISRFKSSHPGIAAYRSFSNPYFKVTVGDFRSKSEAIALLKQIKSDFPSAFVVKENIKYPIVDSKHPVVIDTVQVVRPIKQTIL